MLILLTINNIIITFNMNSQLIKRNLRYGKKYCTTVGTVCKGPSIAKIYCYGLLVSTMFGAGMGCKESLCGKNKDVNVLEATFDGAFAGWMVWLLIPSYVTMNTYNKVKKCIE